mgnify:CR=1 FL=1
MSTDVDPKHFLFHGSRALYAGRNFCSDPTASLFSSIFWGSTAVAMHPEKLTEYLGKRLTPILLVLIIVLFAAGAVTAAGGSSVLDAAGAEPAQLYCERLRQFRDFWMGIRQWIRWQP